MLINILTPMLYSPPIKISASLHRNLDMLVSSLRSLKYRLVMKQTHPYSISSISLKLLSIGPPRTSMMVVPLQLTCFHATRPLTAFCLNRQLSPFKTLFSWVRDYHFIPPQPFILVSCVSLTSKYWFRQGSILNSVQFYNHKTVNIFGKFTGKLYLY